MFTNNFITMKRFKKLNFNDVWALVGRPSNSNGYVVSQQSAAVMERIAQTMSRLAVMGDDEQRSLWLPFRTRRKYSGWGFVPPEKGLLWYKVTISQYEGIYYLLINDLERHYVFYKSANNFPDEQHNPLCDPDIEDELIKLEAYISMFVDWIVAEPDEYNAYIAQNLPYRKRQGKIRRSVLYQLMPSYRKLQNRTEMIQLLEQLKAEGPTTFDSVSLNSYAHVWRIAYDAYEKANAALWGDEYEDSSDQTDREMFVQHSNQGRAADKYDWDSEADFCTWKEKNSWFHPMDVAYARIHLSPMRNEQTNLWEYHLWFDMYGYYADVLTVANALYDKGVRVVISPYEILMGILREDDWVGVSPFPEKYLDRGEITNLISLPTVDEDEESSAENIAKLIQRVDWQPEQQVYPAKMET